MSLGLSPARIMARRWMPALCKVSFWFRQRWSLSAIRLGSALAARKARQASALAAKPQETWTPFRPSCGTISPSELFLPPTSATSPRDSVSNHRTLAGCLDIARQIRGDGSYHLQGWNRLSQRAMTRIKARESKSVSA